MSEQAKIKAAFERNYAVFAKRPSTAKFTTATTIRTTGGRTCEVEEGAWRFKADQPEANAGNDQGPSPAFFTRAALGACLAQGCATWFAVKEVPLDGVEIRVETDFDIRGALGISKDVPVGFQEMRYIIEIDSNASEKEILEVLDLVEKHSPTLSTFSNPIKITRQVNIRQTERTAKKA